jgi:hypothetical protein
MLLEELLEDILPVLPADQLVEHATHTWSRRSTGGIRHTRSVVGSSAEVSRRRFVFRKGVRLKRSGFRIYNR